MKAHKYIQLIIVLCTGFLFSCDKGYTVRFTNYSQYPIDSLIVGENAIVFTNIEIQTETEYKPIKKGKYQITCVTKSKSRFYSNIHIPGNGSGNRSIQIDGTNSVVVLEE